VVAEEVQDSDLDLILVALQEDLVVEAQHQEELEEQEIHHL